MMIINSKFRKIAQPLLSFTYDVESLMEVKAELCNEQRRAVANAKLKLKLKLPSLSVTAGSPQSS